MARVPSLAFIFSLYFFISMLTSTQKMTRPRATVTALAAAKYDVVHDVDIHYLAIQSVSCHLSPLQCIHFSMTNARMQ